ncbi:MAG: type III-A CRISPR-associated RAMP protein Csm4 [Ardenticatenaceae bacterium]|nr:type III-A CRISPR-associated RAMP protein Csm4 [Ardenticatenaceae bacterium]
MTNLTLYQLQPQALGFHFGEEGLELEESRISFPSDSLFAALVATVAEQEGAQAVKDFTAPFANGEPPFRLTSLFPYVGQLPLLPLPMLQIKLTPSASQLPRKFAKKVRFVSPGIFRRLVQGDDMDEYMASETNDCLPANDHLSTNGRFLQSKAIWLTQQEIDSLPTTWLEPPASLKGNRDEQRQRLREPDTLAARHVWQNGSVPRVTLDRATNASTIYLMGRVAFNTECGLWLGVQYTDESWRPRLENLLHHLGDRGIGGERSNGYGAFKLINPPTLLPPLPPNPVGEYQLLLSRYLPRETEMSVIQDTHAAYQLIPVGGWLGSPRAQNLRRKRLTLVVEGSVLGPGAVQGRIADVQPDWDGFPHPVWRSGLALTTPVAAQAVQGKEGQS